MNDKELSRHYAAIIHDLYDELKQDIDASRQPIYVYFDDANKFCNKKFATLLGYDSAEQWARLKGPFPETLVERKSQRTLISAYRNAIEHFNSSTINITWKKKNGKEIKTTVILVPLVFKGHKMALHFITKQLNR